MPSKNWKHLTDKQRKEIVAEYIECGSYKKVGEKHGISPTTVKKWVLKDTESASKCEQKKLENTEEVLEAMKKRKDTKIKLLDKIFKAMDDKLENIDKLTNIKDLATAYGIIMDKELKVKELELQNRRDSNVKEAIANLPALADLIRITPEEKENNK